MTALPWLSVIVVVGRELPQLLLKITCPLTLYVDVDPVMVYAAVPTALVANPPACAIALIVSDEDTVMAVPLYVGEDDVGVEPSVV